MRVSISVALFLTIGFVIFLVFAPQTPEETLNPRLEELTTEPAIETRNVTPEQMLPGPTFDDGELTRLPAVEPPPPPPRKPKPNILNRPVVIAAGIVEIGDDELRFADINPISIDQTCEASDGTVWPCGRFARTEFRQYIRGRPLECKPGDSETSPIIARCRLDGYDVSAWLVLTGWAIPTGDEFGDELDKAKTLKRGQWRDTRP